MAIAGHVASHQREDLLNPIGSSRHSHAINFQRTYSHSNLSSVWAQAIKQMTHDITHRPPMSMSTGGIAHQFIDPVLSGAAMHVASRRNKRKGMRNGVSMHYCSYSIHSCGSGDQCAPEPMKPKEGTLARGRVYDCHTY